MKLVLKKPVSVGETTVAELSFREELVAGDLRGIKLSSLSDPASDDLLKIAGRLCGQTDAVMNKLSLADMSEVIGIIGGFLSGGLETGNKPSP